MWVLVSGNVAIHNHNMLFSPAIFEIFEQHINIITTYCITGMQAKCKMNLCVKYNIPKTIFISCDIRFLPHYVQNHHCATKCKVFNVYTINTTGLFVSIPVVTNVNSCFECHQIQFIHCACLNHVHELWSEVTFLHLL